MGKKYSTQPIEISLNWAAEDGPVGTVISCKIKYRKPDGSISNWIATYDGVARTVSYTGSANSSYGMAGEWTLWPIVTLSDTRSYPGEPIFVRIYEEGE